jgi:sulfatase modifying factor 1
MLRPECNGIAQIWLVGSAPGGDARWGQSDLAGNLWEYTVDYFGPALDCTDCARHVPTPPGTGQYAGHVSRGGAYEYDLGDGLWDRDFYYPSEPRFAGLGFRCAYDAIE